MPALSRSDMQEIAQGYDPEEITLAAIGSHSCLDVCDGAADEQLPNIAVCQRGREAPYARYFRTVRDEAGARLRGCVDEAWVFNRFDEILTKKSQEALREQNVLFVPNRSFTSYCDLSKIEEEFRVPMVGSRTMLRMEEREEEQDYYWLLDKAGLPSPEEIEHPNDIEELSIVKLHHAEKKLERGFFTASSFEEYEEKSRQLIREGVITQESLENARIERYVIGPVFNLNFFHSPLELHGESLDLLGIDWRFESSLDGHVRLPAPQQMELPEHQMVPEMTVVGHNTATLRESLLGEAFDLAEKFIQAAKEYYHPGMIGPFCLQTCVDKDMNFYIYDVAPRIGGGTNVHLNVGHPYGNALYRTNMSSGRRLAREVRAAIAQDRLDEIVT
ncbi:MAG: formate--phosphoribosylaminoimidazolecarboxamide ligase family protein [Candidatus Thermoplasmatota archaeon]|nr:formate--phosphoribosylaminoimidazolecarboxamide ligase family protein [Candidatus Thermoplasmatota archaeon]